MGVPHPLRFLLPHLRSHFGSRHYRLMQYETAWVERVAFFSSFFCETAFYVQNGPPRMDSHGSSQWLVACVAGPRPPAARRPKAEKVPKKCGSGSSARASVCADQWRSPCGGRSGRWRVGPEQRVGPDAVRQEARKRVVKLQQALEVLGETSGPDVDSLRFALEKAFKLSSEPTVEVQITECQGFIARAEKRVAVLDAQRAWRWRLLRKEEPVYNVWRQNCRSRPRLWRPLHRLRPSPRCQG